MLPALILLTILPVFHQTKNTSLLGGCEKSAIAARPTISACLGDNELSSALRKLSAPKYQERAAAETVLRNVAERSVRCRKLVIAAVMEAMDTPEHDFTRDQASFDLWKHGSSLLADLKAVEALNLLIGHLELERKPPFSFNHNPTMPAVIEFGSPALPKLNDKLRQSTDPYLRRDVVFCIAFIGGPSARRALLQALSLETDTCVKSFIQASLRALRNKKRPNHIASEDRLKWYAAFSCSER